MKHSINDLALHLRNLGLREGDTVLVRASIRRIADHDESMKNAEKLIEAMRTVLGESGTIAGLAFTKTFLFPKKMYIYSRSTPPITGGLASALVYWPGSVRSSHPATSFIAIGKNAEYLLKGHDENSSCFHPMATLMELDGKMLLVGCVSESPGFSTIHLVQHHLGLSTQSIFRNRFGVYFDKGNNHTGLFRKRDIPGCSMGFSNFYSHYVEQEKLNTGFVGDAYSILIKVRDAYDIEYGLIKKNPRVALCDNPLCESCRGSLFYNMRDWPFYYFRNAKMIVKRLVSVINKK